MRLSETESRLADLVDRLATSIVGTDNIRMQPGEEWEVDLSQKPPVLTYRVADAAVLGDQTLSVTAHEIAHLLHTTPIDYKAMPWDTLGQNGLAQLLIFAVEDMRIESRFSEDFPGAKSLFDDKNRGQWSAKAVRGFPGLPAKWRFLLNCNRILSGSEPLGSDTDKAAVNKCVPNLISAMQGDTTQELADDLGPTYTELISVVAGEQREREEAERQHQEKLDRERAEREAEREIERQKQKALDDARKADEEKQKAISDNEQKLNEEGNKTQDGSDAKQKSEEGEPESDSSATGDPDGDEPSTDDSEAGGQQDAEVDGSESSDDPVEGSEAGSDDDGDPDSDSESDEEYDASVDSSTSEEDSEGSENLDENDEEDGGSHDASEDSDSDYEDMDGGEGDNPSERIDAPGDVEVDPSEYEDNEGESNGDESDGESTDVSGGSEGSSSGDGESDSEEEDGDSVDSNDMDGGSDGGDPSDSGGNAGGVGGSGEGASENDIQGESGVNSSIPGDNDEDSEEIGNADGTGSDHDSSDGTHSDSDTEGRAPSDAELAAKSLGQDTSAPSVRSTSLMDEMINDLRNDEDHKKNPFVVEKRNQMDKQAKEARKIEREIASEYSESLEKLSEDMGIAANSKEQIANLKQALQERDRRYEIALADLRPEITTLRRYAMMVLKENRLSRYAGNYESGKRIKKNRLYRVLQEDPRLFERQVVNAGLSYAVGINVDQSGSMGGYAAGTKQILAFQTAVIIAEAFEELVDTAFVGFANGYKTGIHNNAGMKYSRRFRYWMHDSRQVAQVQSRRYKGIDTPLKQCRAIMAELGSSYGGTPLAAGLRTTLGEMRKSEAEVKSIISITDGVPHDAAACPPLFKISKGENIHNYIIYLPGRGAGPLPSFLQNVESEVESIQTVESATDVPMAVMNLLRSIIRKNVGVAV